MEIILKEQELKQLLEEIILNSTLTAKPLFWLYPKNKMQ